MLCAVLLWSVSTFVTPYFAHSKAALIGLRVLLGIGEGLGKLSSDYCKVLGQITMDGCV